MGSVKAVMTYLSSEECCSPEKIEGRNELGEDDDSSPIILSNMLRSLFLAPGRSIIKDESSE